MHAATFRPVSSPIIRVQLARSAYERMRCESPFSPELPRVREAYEDALVELEVERVLDQAMPNLVAQIRARLREARRLVNAP